MAVALLGLYAQLPSAEAAAAMGLGEQWAAVDNLHSAFAYGAQGGDSLDFSGFMTAAMMLKGYSAQDASSNAASLAELYELYEASPDAAEQLLGRADALNGEIGKVNGAISRAGTAVSGLSGASTDLMGDLSGLLKDVDGAAVMARIRSMEFDDLVLDCQAFGIVDGYTSAVPRELPLSFLAENPSWLRITWTSLREYGDDEAMQDPRWEQYGAWHRQKQAEIEAHYRMLADFCRPQG